MESEIKQNKAKQNKKSRDKKAHSVPCKRKCDDDDNDNNDGEITEEDRKKIYANEPFHNLSYSFLFYHLSLKPISNFSKPFFCAPCMNKYNKNNNNNNNK